MGGRFGAPGIDAYSWFGNTGDFISKTALFVGILVAWDLMFDTKLGLGSAKERQEAFNEIKPGLVGICTKHACLPGQDPRFADVMC